MEADFRSTPSEKASLNDALAQQKMKSLEVFASGIAHDFNNLLMGVTGNIEIALRDAPPEAPIRQQ